MSSGDSGQQQSQSTGFTTGGWSRPPELFRTSENLVLRLEISFESFSSVYLTSAVLPGHISQQIGRPSTSRAIPTTIW
jgi:hypothetical protein